jgi:hypothetical protein
MHANALELVLHALLQMDNRELFCQTHGCCSGRVRTIELNIGRQASNSVLDASIPLNILILDQNSSRCLVDPCGSVSISLQSTSATTCIHAFQKRLNDSPAGHTGKITSHVELLIERGKSEATLFDRVNSMTSLFRKVQFAALCPY